MSKQQQPPLPQQLILGLNAWNCKSKISNANWESKLNEQVNINQGDSINVKASFIDTRGSSSSNIVLTKDTEISLEYYFYWVHTFNAANGTKLATPTADSSFNLLEQVLVGPDIATLYEKSEDSPGSLNVPSYYYNDPSYNVTNINDADGLPYLVYQSTPNFPVAPIFGPVEDAFDIIPNLNYYVASQGLTTNWFYAGIPNANENKLPNGWNLAFDAFEATQNPQLDLPATAFISFALAAPLPYIKYVVTVVGNTNWDAIDPTLSPNPFSYTTMTSGNSYVIDTPGTINFVALGAANNLAGTVFTYNGAYQPLPNFPISIPSSFFLANPNFSQDFFEPWNTYGDDILNVSISLDGSGNYVLASFSGSGRWLQQFVDNPGSQGEWNIPMSALGFNPAFAPGLSNLVITNFAATSPGPFQYVLTAATVSGGSFVAALVYSDAVAVGTIVKAVNPYAVVDSGRADVYAFQEGSTIPFQYDGQVGPYTPATTRLDIRPVKKKWKMTLKAGSYDPNNLAEILTRNMSRQKVKRANKVVGGPFGNQSTLTVPTDSIWNNRTNNAEVWAVPTGPGQNTFYDAKNTKVYAYPSETDYNINPDRDDMPFLFTPQMNGSELLDSSNPSYVDNFIYANIPHLHSNGINDIPPPTYNINLVPLIKDVRSVSPTLKTVSVNPYYTILPFYSQANQVQEPPSGNSGIFPITFGATQTSLIYNNENNGLFGFNYLHSPILAFLASNTTDLTECTAHMRTTQKSATNLVANFFTTLIDKKSGILLNTMEPRSFWEQLGFNVDALTTDLDDQTKIGFQMTYDDFNNKTTGGFCGSSNIFNPLFRTTNSPDQPNVSDTELAFAGDVVPSPLVYLNALTTTPLVIGTQYVVVSVGITTDGNVNSSAQYAWWIVGYGTENDQLKAEPGTVFTATTTGFNPQGIPPPDDPGNFEHWVVVPTVYVLNQGPLSTISQLQNNYFTVETTNPLNAEKIPEQRDNAGHYLLEVTGYNGIYLDDNSKREIKSVISTYYVSSNSFISTPYPESYTYYHIGAPMALSNIKVRILNPFNLEEATIGPNSSVYLEVTRMLTDQAVEEVEN
jgi:hypothetical protein